MADRSWFFASRGQQQGPYPEARLRQFIVSGEITAETLVWTEGMANWQKAGDVPGLLAGASGEPAVSRPAGLPASAGGPLSVDFGIWDFIWRSFVLLISLGIVIPLPWALVMYFRWMVSCVHIPQRPNLGFSGRVVDAMWFYAVAVLYIAAELTGSQYFGLVADVAQLALYWLLIKWFFANLTSNGQPLGLRFSGSFWGFLGWCLLVVVSVLTVIGWAWAYAAQLRWICGHIEGTRRDVVFIGTGIEFLWRSIVLFLGCLFIIPIPWLYRWFNRWLASQIVLVDKTTLANA
jgi:hypothetical protein